jgi:hypothetical protein
MVNKKKEKEKCEWGWGVRGEMNTGLFGEKEGDV